MVKTKTKFICQNCGSMSPRWVGKCPDCDSWNSFVEELDKPAEVRKGAGVVLNDKPVRLDQVELKQDKRLSTTISEFDRVMGGGIVAGSVTLIGGDPGIGKSTLSLQVATVMSQQNQTVLYVSGEESAQQTSMRAKRLGFEKDRPMYLVNQIDLTVIIKHIEELQPQIVVIDSIQVVHTSEVASSPGSVTQVRECSAILTHLAKSKGISIFIIGHVTKEGALAGPRVLEHIVDTVLYFEGDRYSSYRILRAVKNRFGSTNEIGIFEMTASGLTEVPNPSEIFLSERPQGASGSAVVPIMEGTRPFLVEIQGLVSRSSFGVSRQKTQGFDQNRLALLIAVLEKRLGLNLADRDVFLNVVGGVKVVDPSADLGVILAIASAFLDKPIPADVVILGEVGLSSEVRSVSQVQSRINEAERLGFKTCLIPKNNLKNQKELKKSGLKIVPVETVQQALDYIQ